MARGAFAWSIRETDSAVVFTEPFIKMGVWSRTQLKPISGTWPHSVVGVRVQSLMKIRAQSKDMVWTQSVTSRT